MDTEIVAILQAHDRIILSTLLMSGLGYSAKGARMAKEALNVISMGRLGYVLGRTLGRLLWCALLVEVGYD